MKNIGNIIKTFGFSKCKLETIVDAFSKGFWRECDYKEAINLGFSDVYDYFIAKDFEIDNPIELDTLKFRGFTGKKQWLDFWLSELTSKKKAITTLLDTYFKNK